MPRRKRTKRPPSPGSKEARWAEAKRKCRLSAEDLRKAKELGLNPRKLPGLAPSRSQPWKAPVSVWLRELHARTFPEQARDPQHSSPTQGQSEWTSWEAELDSIPEPEPAPLAEVNEAALLRQRNFRRAGEFVAEAMSLVPAVERVTLFGSVAQPLRPGRSRHAGLKHLGKQVLHECKDVDLAVSLSDLGALASLQRARTRGLRSLWERESVGIAHHQVDVFILEPKTGRYLGRLCGYKSCPADKPPCRVPGCGRARHLQQHEGFELRPEALAPESCRVLFDAGESRVPW